VYKANGYLGFPTVASIQNMWKQFFIRLQVKGRRLNARWQERCARRRWLKREKRRRKAEQVGFLFNMYSSQVLQISVFEMLGTLCQFHINVSVKL